MEDVAAVYCLLSIPARDCSICIVPPANHFPRIDAAIVYRMTFCQG
jgi:hypothetical protein